MKHYSDLWTSGKAMFVCLNKVTCVRMYHFVQKYWENEIKILENYKKTASQQEVQELDRKIKWMKETEMAVVISQEQNEVQTFQKWNLDIAPHRMKMELMDLAGSMDKEERRYVREGFSSDEELSLYDMLFSENLSKEEIKTIKKVSVDLLHKIKTRIAELDHWADKQETKAEVDNLIRDTLWAELPACYDEIKISEYRQKIYEYFYTRYKETA